jgi:hypothetical protein
MRTRTPAIRATIAVAALAALIALFVVLAGGGDDGTDSAPSQPRSAQASTEGQPPEPQRPAIEQIVVRGGTPVGGVNRLEYARGERVRFLVRSNLADEVHVHGFDISKDVAAGGSVQFGFPADIEGVFEVELENSKIEIAELRIKP